jgi:hypothetical protein
MLWKFCGMIHDPWNVMDHENSGEDVVIMLCRMWAYRNTAPSLAQLLEARNRLTLHQWHQWHLSRSKSHNEHGNGTGQAFLKYRNLLSNSQTYARKPALDLNYREYIFLMPHWCYPNLSRQQFLEDLFPTNCLHNTIQTSHRSIWILLTLCHSYSDHSSTPLPMHPIKPNPLPPCSDPIPSRQEGQYMVINANNITS